MVLRCLFICNNAARTVRYRQHFERPAPKPLWPTTRTQEHHTSVQRAFRGLFGSSRRPRRLCIRQRERRRPVPVCVYVSDMCVFCLSVCVIICVQDPMTNPSAFPLTFTFALTRRPLQDRFLLPRPRGTQQRFSARGTWPPLPREKFRLRLSPRRNV